MSSETDDEDQATRPISVAELLARNGTIGAPPAGGHRRRRRGNAAAVSVAELTGEIPVIRDEPEVAAAEVEPEAETEVEPVRTAPQLADDPRPRRGDKPERGHDPRPQRRSSDAEQMAYDPVDESVDLAELVADQAAEEETLRSYLKASGGTLFSGGTVADDLARRGVGDEPEEAAETAGAAPEVPGGWLAALRTGAAAALQSALAVVLGAGLFLGFDQLWRWNTIVALVLSVLVILGLVIAVRVVRKTEDIASTLIAVAVGALVTLGPLALLQSYG